MSETANWRQRTAALAMAASLLAACAPASSSCPPLVDYDRATLAQVASELERLGAGSATSQLIADYGVLRAQIRACR
ncbi:MAG: hypothetical protein L0210_05605 [Rhodospirillales bacterium]|nr:hypothetical protein [Rhodospirillales bacterium]